MSLGIELPMKKVLVNGFAQFSEVEAGEVNTMPPPRYSTDSVSCVPGRALKSALNLGLLDLNLHRRLESRHVLPAPHSQFRAPTAAACCDERLTY
jgi:hypothetical protein